jgi:hypothetical protein
MDNEFIINVFGLQNEHKLVQFTVPQGLLIGLKDYDDIMERARWYYINYIDLFSCIMGYSYIVFPANLIKDLVVIK